MQSKSSLVKKSNLERCLMCFWLALSLFSILFHCFPLVFVLIVKRVQIVKTAFGHISRRLKLSPDLVQNIRLRVTNHLIKHGLLCVNITFWRWFTLKEKQMQILRIVIVEKKDALAVLPTGFGQVLVYQFMAPFADFMDSGFRPTETNLIVSVVSPLNALITDQVTKLRECGLKAWSCDSRWVSDLVPVICIVFEQPIKTASRMDLWESFVLTSQHARQGTKTRGLKTRLRT